MITIDVLQDDQRAAAFDILKAAVEAGNCLPYTSMAAVSVATAQSRFFTAHCSSDGAQMVCPQP